MSPYRFVFYLAPDFSMISLMSMTEPLRAANETAAQTLYEYRFVSVESPVRAVNDMAVSVDVAFPEAGEMDAVIVCTSYRVEQASHPRLITWLRRLDAHGVRLGATDTGAFVLAEAGLIGQRPIALHWMNMEAFREKFPKVQISQRLYEQTDRRLTCAGATTGMDLILDIIARHHGGIFSRQVANHFIRGPVRVEEHQSASIPIRFGTGDSAVNRAIALMEEDLETPKSIAEIAHLSGLTTRTMERLFKKHLGLSPSKFYQQCRLRNARRLLHQTSLPVSEIALASGFASRTQFSAAYKSTFGRAPAQDRTSPTV